MFENILLVVMILVVIVTLLLIAYMVIKNKGATKYVKDTDTEYGINGTKVSQATYIDGYPNYSIDEKGRMWSHTKGIIKELKPDCDDYVRLYNNGKSAKFKVAKLMKEYWGL